MKAPKVLLITHKMNGNIWCKGLFEKHGCETNYIITSTYGSKWNILIRLKRRLNMNIACYMRRRQKRLYKKVLSICESFRPNIIVVLQGIHFCEEQIRNLRKKHFVVLYLSDKIWRYPQLKRLASYYDVVYAYTKDDYELLREHDINCKFFPPVGNPFIYRNQNLIRDIDISFVGSLYPINDYGNRYEVLKQIIHDFPNTNIQIYGKCAPLRKPSLFTEWVLSKEYRKHFKNKYISEEQCNTIYNRSKICLCIEPATGNGWSSRLANILLTGSFVLTTNNEIAKSVLGDCLVFFSDYEDLKSKIKYYLNHDEERCRIAYYGSKEFLERIRTIQSISREEDVLHEYSLSLDRVGVKK